MRKILLTITLLFSMIGFAQSTYSESAFQNGWLAQQLSPQKYYFEVIPIDKTYHMVGGIALSAAGYGVGYSLTGSKKKAFLIGFGVATLAGFTKETIDYFDYGRFDWADLGVTALSGLVVSGTLYLTNTGENREEVAFRKAERRKEKLINKMN